LVWAGRTEVERLVEPYGLVAKAGVWYLVCAWQGRVRVKRVSSLLEVRLTEEHFSRPLDFDLADFWNAWRQEEENRHVGFRATVRVAPDFIPALVYELGESVRQRIEQAGPPDAQGWIRLDLFFESHYEARNRMMGFGGGVEVLEPLALRMSVIDLAEQVRGVYG
jgi:predicted DNA-binding transcriptional regulator YafY